MEKEKLKAILDKHLKWLRDEPSGSRADLSRADLSGVNLSWVNLSGANLSGANLPGANLSGANLSRADLSGVNLSGVNLSWVNLSGANLSGANLPGANLSGANLSRANLSGANLSRANLSGVNLSRADLSGVNLSGAKNVEKAVNIFYPIACPEYGAFIGWKKARAPSGECIVKLRITEDALRSSATTRKCRSSMAEVLEIQSLDGNETYSEAVSGHDRAFRYVPGETVSVANFDENRWNECAPGIHFYITRDEAVRHAL